MAKAFSPAVLTANHLLDGDAVWWTGAGWNADIAHAKIASTPEEREAFDAIALSPAHEADVVGPYLVDVSVTADGARPTVRREAIRADRAPTFAYLGNGGAPFSAAA